jgi:hypothetical protein
MSYPDYISRGWQNIIVSLDNSVAIVKLNRAKQYVGTPFLFDQGVYWWPHFVFCETGATRS